MTEVAAGLGALAEAVSFLSYFNNLEDLSQRGEVMYPLAWMLLLALIAVPCPAHRSWHNTSCPWH